MGEEEKKLIYTWNSADYEALEKAINSIRASSPIGTISADPIISCCSSVKKEPTIVKLTANYTEGRDLINQNPTGMDKIIKQQLAIELARQMIEEDLITVYHNFNIDFNVEEFRAEVKIVQE